MIVCNQIRKLRGGYVIEIRAPYCDEAMGFGEVVCKDFAAVVELLRLASGEDPAALRDLMLRLQADEEATSLEALGELQRETLRADLYSARTHVAEDILRDILNAYEGDPAQRASILAGVIGRVREVFTSSDESPTSTEKGS